MTTPAAASKNQYGARIYPIPIPGTETVEELTSVSQVLKVLAAPGLEVWRQKVIAEQFSKRPDLIMLAADENTRYDAIKQALNATQSKANIGTSIHRFSEMVDDGTLDWALVPEAAKPWVENYVRARDTFGWKVVFKEVTIYNHTYGYAGTADRFMELDGEVCPWDLKTSAEVYADMALQLALYGNGEGIWVPPSGTPDTDALEKQLDDDIANGVNVPAGRRKWSQEAIKEAKTALAEMRWREYARKGTHLPMPAGLNTNKGIIVHLTEQKCELVPLDLSDCRDVVFGMARIHHWKNRRNIVGKPLKAKASPEDIKALHELDKELDEDFSAPVALPPSNRRVVTGHVVPATTLQELSERSVEANNAQSFIDPDTLKDRVRALSQEAKQELVFRWPSGVPTLKVGGHTEEQLSQLAQLIFEVQTKFAKSERPEIAPVSEEEAVARIQKLFPGSTVEPRAFDAPPPPPPQYDEEPFDYLSEPTSHPHQSTNTERDTR